MLIFALVLLFVAILYFGFWLGAFLLALRLLYWLVLACLGVLALVLVYGFLRLILGFLGALFSW